MMSRIAVISFGLALAACAVTADDGGAPPPTDLGDEAAKLSWTCVDVGFGTYDFPRGQKICALEDTGSIEPFVPGEPSKCAVLHPLECGDGCCDKVESVESNAAFCKQDCVIEPVRILTLEEDRYVYIAGAIAGQVHDEAIQFHTNACE